MQSVRLAGSDEKTVAYQELLDSVVETFEAVLRQVAALSGAVLNRAYVAVVGAGDALSSYVVGRRCRIAEAASTFARLIKSATQP